MLSSPYKAYQQSSVQTASPAQLVIMLYDGAIRFTKAGIEAIHNKKYDIANTNLKKAQSIINELIASLNFDYAISHDMVRIYEYMLHQLIQANMKKQAEFAEEVLGYLQDLGETWKKSAKTVISNNQSSRGLA